MLRNQIEWLRNVAPIVTLLLAFTVASVPSAASAKTQAPRAPKARPPRPLLGQPTIEPKLFKAAAAWVGTPYFWGDERRGVGTDCSGFTQSVARDAFVIDLPRATIEQFQVGKAIKKTQLKAGDLVFFDMKNTGVVDHVGFYAGNGKFVHASRSRGVVYDELTSGVFKRAYRGARRIIGVGVNNA